MARARSTKARRKAWKVGDRVRFRFGASQVIGVIIEDRGPIGVGGRRLLTVQARIDPMNDIVLEMPAEELRAA